MNPTLCGVPREVRDMICSYVIDGLPSNIVRIKPIVNNTRGFNNNLAFLRVNKQLNKEFSTIFFARQQFIVGHRRKTDVDNDWELVPDVRSFERFLQVVQPANLAAIRNLTVLIPYKQYWHKSHGRGGRPLMGGMNQTKTYYGFGNRFDKTQLIRMTKAILERFTGLINLKFDRCYLHGPHNWEIGAKQFGPEKADGVFREAEALVLEEANWIRVEQMDSSQSKVLPIILRKTREIERVDEMDLN